MALILNKVMSGKRCWACGMEIMGDKPAIMATGASDVVYMHSDCANSISQQLLRDISQLIDLGYENEDE